MGENKGQIADDSAEMENPFATIGMIKFWVLSTIFYATFPTSLAISYLILGLPKNKHLIRALVSDFCKTFSCFLCFWR